MSCSPEDHRHWRLCSSRTAMMLVAILLVTSLLVTSSSAHPLRVRRRAHARPSTYSYHVQRVARCHGDDVLFADCYICGKISDDARIYDGCCRRHDSILRYCEQLLS